MEYSGNSGLCYVSDSVSWSSPVDNHLRRLVVRLTGEYAEAVSSRTVDTTFVLGLVAAMVWFCRLLGYVLVSDKRNTSESCNDIGRAHDQFLDTGSIWN